jgi:ATP-dependent Clp protease ATP-binding subunit ClpC
VCTAAISSSGRVRFSRKPEGAGPEGAEDVVVLLEGGEDEDPHVRGGARQLTGGGDPVEVGHSNVHQYDIGSQPAGLLVGSPPGYLGHDEGGQLTEAVRRQPFSVVLFDEIEKAHPDLFHTLLQILEDGHLTDAQRRTVDFKNTVLIMTSNLGTAELHKTQIGFAGAKAAGAYETMKEKVLHELRDRFRPEFLNRIDEVIVFHELSREEITQIVDRMIRGIRDQLESQGLTLEVTPAAKDHLGRKGYDPTLGARPLRRAIQQLIEDPLSERILWKDFHAGEVVVVDAEDDEIILRSQQPQEAETSLSLTRG